MPDATLIDALQRLLGPNGLLQGEALRARQATFWNTGPMQAAALLRPASVEALQQCLQLCHAARQPLVPLGGNTGLAEGTAAGPHELLLSLERLAQIESIDLQSQTVTVQAGVVLETLQQALAAQGWMFPVDLGARGSCTLGGMIASNAGGFAVLAHGMMRQQVLGLEVLLADGSRLSSLQGFLKNNSGYDLKQLFIGSEGTLGVISRAVLRIKPLLAGRATALVGVAGFAELTALLQLFQRDGEGCLTAFEVMWPQFWAINTGPLAAQRSSLAGEHAYYLLVELQAASSERAAGLCEALLETAFTQGLLEDAVLARSEAERQRLWAIRESYEAEQQLFARTQGFDVSLAIADMPAFVEQLEQRLAQLQAAAGLLVFGHLADGNLHVTIGLQQPLPAAHAVEQLLYDCLAGFAGSVSAEHGIGLEKKPWLGHSRSAEELHWMRQLKALFDPHGLLNRGKIFDQAAAAAGNSD